MPNSPSPYKRGRTEDVLKDKITAAMVTGSETEPPDLSSFSTPSSYASKLLNPLNQYRKAVVEDFVMNDDDYQYYESAQGPNIRFSQRVADKIDLTGDVL